MAKYANLAVRIFHGIGSNAQFHSLPTEESVLQWFYPTGVRPGSEYSFDWRSNIVQRSTYSAHRRARLAQLDPTLRLREGARPGVTREYTALFREEAQRVTKRVFRPRQMQPRQSPQLLQSVTTPVATASSVTPTVPQT